MFNYLRKRDRSLKFNHDDHDSIYKSLYNSIEPNKNWNNNSSSDQQTSSEFGGVFNLEFSPDGSLLVAACEKKSIVLFDPISEQQMCCIKQAHEDCVNCVKFMDNRMFATCSDDTSVALWDTRNLKTKIRTLHGHSNWVKNIEYSKENCLLVTSGFDGSVFTWDINSYTEQGLIYQKVFHTPGLMRCRLTPDDSKLVICTTGGYLIIIHDLDLTTLAKDLCGFRPNLFRLMQLRQQFIPNAAKFEHAFSRKQRRNRVELVSDFPVGNDAEVVCSLQIHPQGWCALSRNISFDESSEWTCIHDIQDFPESEEEDANDDDETSASKRLKTDGCSRTSGLQNSTALRNATVQALTADSSNAPSEVLVRNNQMPIVRIEAPLPEENEAGEEAAQENMSMNLDIWAADVTIRNRSLRHTTARTFNSQQVYGIHSGITRRQQNTLQKNVAQNANRMIYYITEPHKGKGFIKELCFSADGRIVCSPYDNGVRLLAFDESCHELSTALLNGGASKNGPAKEFHQIKVKECHSDVVVSTKFSPRFPLLVTGCLQGKIVWHQPLL